MHVQSLSGMFNFTFEKTSEEIIAAATRKRDSVRTKIGEREGRIANIRSEYKITDESMINMLAKARQQNESLHYNNSSPTPSNAMTEGNVTIGAGIVNMLLTERDFIESEKSQVEKLDVIVRNLRDLPNDKGGVRGHRLSYDELRYLGF